MGGCCSDVSEVPDIIIPDPVDGKGYTVTLEKLGALVGDTYEIFTEHDGQHSKWLNIRRYRTDAGADYRLENYVRKEGEDSGERLANAQADNFTSDMYKYKKPEQESSGSEDNFSDSPDDPGEFTVHKAKWSVKNKVVIQDKEGNPVGEIKCKAKGKLIRESIVRQHAPAEGEAEGRKYWETKYDSRIKKIKYTIELNGQEPVSFKLKGSIRKKEPCVWECDAFKCSSSNPNSSAVETLEGHNPATAMMMAFICTQVLCPGDIHDGCQPSGHDDVFPPLEDLNHD